MEEYCEIGFGGYDECPELWFSIYIIDDDGNDLLDNSDAPDIVVGNGWADYD